MPISIEILDEVRKKFQINCQSLYANGGEIDLLIGMCSPKLHEHIKISDDSEGLSVLETRFGQKIILMEIIKNMLSMFSMSKFLMTIIFGDLLKLKPLVLSKNFLAN